MTYLEILIIAVSLCFDTLAVSVAGGMVSSLDSLKKKLKPMLIFGAVQASFLLLGWLLGSSFMSLISRWDHWLAFALLLYIGGKMLLDSFRTAAESNYSIPCKSCSNSGSLKGSTKNQNEVFNNDCNLNLIANDLKFGIATSIDAAAVGISFAAIEISGLKLIYSVAITGLATAAACYIGIRFGNVLGKSFGSKASLVGGIVLILIGIKIILEHLFL